MYGLFAPDARISRFAVTCLIMIASLHLLYLAQHRLPALSIPPSPSSPLLSPTQNLSTIPFPQKIWQTGRTGFINLDDESKHTITSWLKLNSDWRYELLTDSSAETYVRTTFPHRPDLISLYLGLGPPILRADMLRYLLMLGDGGVYSDMDTLALKPIASWLPAGLAQDIALVVGVEYDRLEGGRWVDWTLDLQFTNWAIMAKPGHPALEHVLTSLGRAVFNKALELGQDIGHLSLTQHEILNTTGPALFTMAIFEYLEITTEREFTWRNVSGLKDPVLVGDVLILPIDGFGNSQPHSGAGGAEGDGSFVRHLFRGSWKQGMAMRPEETEKEEEKKKEEGEDGSGGAEHTGTQEGGHKQGMENGGEQKGG